MGDIPSLRHVDCNTQFGVIYNLAEVVLNPTVSVTDEFSGLAGHSCSSCLVYVGGVSLVGQLVWGFFCLFFGFVFFAFFHLHLVS